ncbi:LysR family transcriptional regulator [Nocardia neocaledoniensis NBRC 108232]|uniref:DNA-binding transcriptional LysR family regulator n=1 Tax=Nocardia neocaledoniensis TaxID=236511 RepID=A0A317N721_9NOCA|nr:LysR family transcriptional regulator [Nocardia neocaledoniensis]PWV70809.1 DNA-binding transcriptional LysR family regulator [Nocardia neocaledoniensis]GEM34826.1 LysR family transcriptional regulator [Nocardia neocaledoniensis NBRC 108232]
MDFRAVATFVAVADTGQFQEAAVDLGITQQAVSKRVAALEREYGVRLFRRTPRGAELTAPGRDLLPHARDILTACRRAEEALRPPARPLRVDVIATRGGAATLLRRFHRAHPTVELDVVTLRGEAAIAAVADGAIDAALLAITGDGLPGTVRTHRVHDEPLQLLVGAEHPLAEHLSLRTAELREVPLWMPGLTPGTEWAAYYRQLSAAFTLDIDRSGPNFGMEHLLDTIEASTSIATVIGVGTVIDPSSRPRLHRIDLRDPTPCYPWSVCVRTSDTHPALPLLLDHFARDRPPEPTDRWLPTWART